MLSIEFYKSQVDVLNNEFTSSYINKIEQVSRYDFCLYFSKKKSKPLFISLNATLPFVLLKDMKLNVSLYSIFLKNLKHYLLNSKLISATIGNEDNIVVLNFLKIDDLYEKHKYQLIIELFKINSNILLIQDDKIIDCFHHKPLDTKNPQIPGIFYKFPAKSQYFRNINKEDIEFFNDYIDSIHNKFLKEKYKKYVTQLKRKEKSLRNKLKKLNQDIKKAQEKLIYKDFGDYCLMNLNNIQKGDSSFEYEGVTIELDVEKSPTANMNNFYKIYKKAKGTIEFASKQIEETFNNIEYITAINNQIDFYNEKDYEELLLELSQNKLIPVSINKKQSLKISSSVMPYYYDHKGTKIGIGKNNLQNDYLSFKLASKNDTYLHIQNDYGPHVIVFSNNPSNEVLEIAASMALYGAKKGDGDVLYTKVSNIKKGKTIGLALVKEYKTIHISHIKHDMKEIFNNLKRFSK